MSIIESALGRVRPPGEVATDGSKTRALVPEVATAAAEPPHSDLVHPADLAPLQTVSMQADEGEILGRFWRGKAGTAVVNQFREVRGEVLGLLAEVRARGAAPIVLVTSALPGDGKTFVAAAVARTFASAPDYQVTLLDFDLVRHQSSTHFGAADLPGVLNCLSGEMELRDVVCGTDVPGLRFVPAGTGSSDKREAFIGHRLDDLLARLRGAGKGRLHVIDTSPILPVIESAILANKVDLVIVVVRAGVTAQAAVSETLSKLGADANVCIIVNGVTRFRSPDYYNY